VAGRLIGSGEAAKALGVSTRTLARWVQEERISPALVTAGGHYRFDLDELRGQLAELARRAREERD
jgi:excisionase family DNA binding protein